MKENICSRIVKEIRGEDVESPVSAEEAVEEKNETRVESWSQLFEKTKVIELTNLDKFQAAIRLARATGICSLDLETTGLDPHVDQIACIQVGIPKYKDEKKFLVREDGLGPNEHNFIRALIINLNKKTDEDKATMLNLLISLLEDDSVLVVLHNAIFDLKMLRAAIGRRFDARNIFDTMIASQLVTAGDFVPESQFEKWCEQKELKVTKEGQKVTYFNKNGLEVQFEKNNQKFYKPRFKKHNLAQVTQRHLGVGLDKKLQKHDWTQRLSPEMIQYAAMDVAVLLPLYEILQELIEENELVEIACLEFECIQVAAEIEYCGMPFDTKKALALIEKVQREEDIVLKSVKSFTTEIDNELGELFNINSNKHVLNLLKRLAKTEGLLSEDGESYVIKRTQDELLPLSTKDEVITIVASALPENNSLRVFIEHLRQYRKKKKMGAFLKKYIKLTNTKTGRLHTSLRQLNPQGTGRFSAFAPGIQQVPRDPDIRSLFCVQEGKIITCDFSTIEMRIMATLSKDKALIQAFRDEIDVHTFTAANVLKKQMSEVSITERKAAKAFNFGLIYGMNANTLKSYAENSYGVKLSLEESEDVRDEFFKLYQGIENWHEDQRKKSYGNNFEVYASHTFEEGYFVEDRPVTRTLGQRLRVWPCENRVSLRGHNYLGKVGSITEVYNTPCQGTGADIIKTAMCFIYEYIVAEDLTDIKIIGTIHDELILEVPEEQASDTKIFLERLMIEAGELFISVPVEVESKICKSWAGE